MVGAVTNCPGLPALTCAPSLFTHFGRLTLTSPKAVLFEFEFDEFEARGAGVLDRARLARILPDEIAIMGRHAAVSVPRNDFGEHTAMDIDAQAWNRLRDLPCRLPRFQDHAPAANARIIHDLSVAIHTARGPKPCFPRARAS